jgi:pyridoxine kinase
MDGESAKPTIIIISSHVADGSVGGRLQAFALERLGFPVVLVPTVIMPWHPGRGAATQIVPPMLSFADCVKDIARAPWFAGVGAILSGYLADATQAGPIAELVAAARDANNSFLHLCDPILADAEGPYRAPSVVAAVRNVLLPRADIATPNRHELMLVADKVATDNAGLVELARRTGASEVVVTSAFAEAGQIANLLVRPRDAFSAVHAALPAAPNGTGDLFAALYLASRLDGVEATEAMHRALDIVLRLVELAEGGDVLPLVANQAVLFE